MSHYTFSVNAVTHTGFFFRWRGWTFQKFNRLEIKYSIGTRNNIRKLYNFSLNVYTFIQRLLLRGLKDMQGLYDLDCTLRLQIGYLRETPYILIKSKT